jgi:hypothetical protein
VTPALASLRTDPRVDRDRIGLWFFSAGGLAMGSFLDPVPEGVAAVAGTYAAVADPVLDETGLRQAVDTTATSTVPLLLIRPSTTTTGSGRPPRRSSGAAR